MHTFSLELDEHFCNVWSPSSEFMGVMAYLRVYWFEVKINGSFIEFGLFFFLEQKQICTSLLSINNTYVSLCLCRIWAHFLWRRMCFRPPAPPKASQCLLTSHLRVTQAKVRLNIASFPKSNSTKIRWSSNLLNSEQPHIFKMTDLHINEAFASHFKGLLNA